MSNCKGSAALILAAGYPTHLSALKPLLPLGQTTVIGEVVTRFRTAGVEDIRVPCRYGANGWG
jgi:molybdenum cofactor cytidylyltransferase